MEKFEKIKKELNAILNSSLFQKSKNSEIIPINEENIRKTVNEYLKKNEKELKPFYQKLNQDDKKK